MRDRPRPVVAIVGVTSAIGRELAGILAARGNDLLLFARHRKEAVHIARDIEVRYRTKAIAKKLDVLRFEDDELRTALREMPGLEGVVICTGYLGDSERAVHDETEAALILDTNFTGTAKVADIAGKVLSRTGGYLCVLSSVAGDRPRRRVQAYGVAKQKLNSHMKELRGALKAHKVRVITIKLGPVDTPMTYGRRPQRFTISAQSAARGIATAIQRNAGPVYVPARWGVIMRVIALIPAPIYRKMDL
jgi:decaprenylphospho-beta-D-erythro-pentofuranosid-2-ulose 2-reductase